MATWDGSSHELEESDRFVYSDENSVAHNVPSWIFYPSNENVFLQSVDVPYCPNAIVTLKQNEEHGSRICELRNVHGICQGQDITQDSMESVVEAATQGTTRCNAQGTLVYRGKRVRNFQSNKQYLETSTGDNSNVVQYSNLHPSANEFIPHSLTQFCARQGNNNATSSTVAYKQDNAPDMRLSNSRERYERRYRTKKNVAHKERIEENWHAQRRDAFKSNYRAQNSTKYGKHQNGTGTHRQQGNNCSVDATKQVKQLDVGESEVSQVTTMNYDSERLKSRDKEEKRRKQQNESNVPGYSGMTSAVRRLRSSKEWKINRYECVNREKWGKSQENVKDCKEKYKGAREEINVKQELVNWRQKGECNNKPFDTQKRRLGKRYEDDDASQRERLTEQLNRGQLECLVCCEYIKQSDYIWSCLNCYHVLHLKCIKKWAKSSQADNGWRCPACQNVSTEIPLEYYCFCGKTNMPEWNRRDVAHSCGEVCGRSRSKNNCSHKCTLLCHPGSCPPCATMINKSCGCGRTSQMVQCSADTLLLCDATCGKELNCGKHTCQRKCHHGECGTCNEIVQQECYCGKSRRETICQSDVTSMYSCESRCEKLLDCGNHKCEKLCHPGACERCRLTPEYVTTCCCGQTPLEAGTRKNCLDAIPVCDKVCSKTLKCGQPNNPHRCVAKCHEGECPTCDLNTVVKCRCGNMDREIACKDLTTKADDARCEKKCTKKRSCGKHKCNQLCCIDVDHICPLPCSKTLSCGRHKCEQTCHKGRCQSCWRSSFEELYCECGMAVIYPPVPCGTRRPACDRPCSRQHPCEHEVFHNCHSEAMCPPCTVLTQKWCHGKHELRKAVPCYVNEISCGLPCNKMLSCGRHKCITTCHSGACEKTGHRCTQPCTMVRELCGHICGAPCHEGKCPDTPCKEIVKVTCQCGHRSSTRVCAENAREYQRIASNILASKMADMQLGHSIDLEEVFGQGTKRQNQLKTLECNDECKLIERNRRLALGLQIANPDLSGKLMPRYSDFMKQWAKKDAHFCQMVHDKLTELVQLAKTSKQKSRSYSFDNMNRDKRHFIHESCEHFGCESQAYDQEPKRNVVATAVKDKCWLPSYSLLEIVQRENGQRKVPGPMLNTSKANGSSNRTILALPLNRNQKSLPAASTSRSPEPEIDYFEYKGFDYK